MDSTSSHQDKFFQVLPLVLRRREPEGGYEYWPGDLCSFLQVSSRFRQAVQQARVRCLISSLYHSKLCSPAGITNFCYWLVKHPGLAFDLELTGDSAEYEAVAQSALLLALQACAAVAAAASAAPAARALAEQQQQHQQRAGPASLSAVVLGSPALAPTLQLNHASLYAASASPAVIAALASADLHGLGLHMETRQMSPTLLGAISCLCNLQGLSVNRWVDPVQDAANAASFRELVASISHLQHLTSLALYPTHPGGLEHLPTALRDLQLQGYSTSRMPAADAAAASGSALVDLRYLTSLQELNVETIGDSTMRLQLPPQLSCLSVSGSLRLLGGEALGSPEGLYVELLVRGAQGLQLLRDLSTVQQPWGLCLDNLGGAAYYDGEVEQGAAAAALALCTSMTSLEIRELTEDNRVGWLRYAAALHHLQRLELCCESVPATDLLQLSALTALTHVSLKCDAGLTDHVASTLACSFDVSKLVVLELSCHDLGSAGVIPVIAKLTGLRSLWLWCATEAVFAKCCTPFVLGQLLPVTQLTRLDLPLGDTCPDEARQHFLSQMPGLNCINT